MVEEIQRHRSFPREDTTTGPWENFQPREATHAWPVLPGNWNPPGQFGHGPDDIALQYPRSDATAVEMGSGRMNLDSAGNFMDPPAMDWYGENRPMQKTSWWPTKLGNRYRNEAFNEMMGVNMSGYRDDEFGGFGQNYGNPHLDRINPYGGATPWEETGFDIHGMGTGETSEFFPPLTIGDLPTSEFGEEIIEEDDGSWDIWDFIQQIFPGGKADKGIETLMENKQQSNLDNWELIHLMSNGYTLEEAQEILERQLG